MVWRVTSAASAPSVFRVPFECLSSAPSALMLTGIAERFWNYNRLCRGATGGSRSHDSTPGVYSTKNVGLLNPKSWALQLSQQACVPKCPNTSQIVHIVLRCACRPVPR